MRIDFLKAETACYDIRKLVTQLKENQMELEQCRAHFPLDSDTYLEIDKAVKKIDSHILKAEKIAFALKKIANLYQKTEMEIISSVEGDGAEKPGFIPITKIINQTDFEWSIK